MKQQGQCVFDLNGTDTEVQTIINISNNSNGVAGIQAKNILNHGFGFDIFDPNIYPNQSQARIVKDVQSKEINTITAFPNPASGFLNFKYKLERPYSNLAIKIYDTNGKTVGEIPIESSGKGFASWNVSKLIPGIYFYSICSNNHSLDTGKLVVVK